MKYLRMFFEGEGAGAGGSAAAPPPVEAKWYDGFKPELKGYVEKKAFGTPEVMADSYLNLEKLVGAPQDKVIKLDDQMDEGKWDQAFKKLGKPNEAKDYKIDLPAEGADPKFADWAKGAFHKANLTQAQAEALSKEWNGYAGNTTAEMTRAEQIKGEESQKQLKTEWGAAYEQNMKQAKQAATSFGVKAEVIDAMEKAAGSLETMKFFQSIGAKLGEDSFVSGGSKGGSFSGNVMTPDAAKTEIAMLRADQGFVARYVNGDAEAKARMGKLHEWAYPEAQN
jgi:hypothetical protein